MRFFTLTLAIVLLAPLIFTAGAGDALAQSGPLLEASERFKDITASDVVQMLLSIARWFLALLGVIAVFAALWAAFVLMTAGGNEEKVGEGKKILTWAVVGVVVAMLSFSIVSITQSLFDAPPAQTPAGPAGNGGSGNGEGDENGDPPPAGVGEPCPNPSLPAGGCPFGSICDFDTMTCEIDE